MKYDNLTEVLHKIGADMRDASKRGLGSKRRGRNTNWGVTKRRQLQKSLVYDLVETKNKFIVALESKGAASRYATFVEMGVSGTKTQYDTPFSYTDKMPPVDAILEWMRLKPVRLRDDKGKFVKQTESRMRSMAYMIAQGIKRDGVPPLEYGKEGIRYAMKKHRTALSEALVQDVRFEIRNRLQT